jgi:hypothetical protein
MDINLRPHENLECIVYIWKCVSIGFVFLVKHVFLLLLIKQTVGSPFVTHFPLHCNSIYAIM